MKDIRILGILLLALAVRMVMLYSVFADVQRAITPDSKDYLSLTMWLPERFEHWSLFTEPEIFRTPGYPILMAGARLATAQWIEGTIQFGPYRHEPASPYHKIIISFQVLLDLHLVLLTFFLGRSFAGHGAGLLAALLQALSPLAAAASCRILSDSIFAFMLIAALLLLLRHFRTGGWWSLVSAAFIMGAACYVRPVGLAFSAVMALVIVFSRRGMGGTPTLRPEEDKTTGKMPVGLMGETPMLRPEAVRAAGRPRRLLRMAAFVCIVAACIAPWIVRNITVADYYGFSSFATDSLYWYSAAEIEARQQGRSALEMREMFRGEELVDPNAPWNFSPGGLARWRWAKARSIIAAHPMDFLDIHMRGNIAFWLPGAPDALEVLGYTSGNKGTLAVLHREGLVAAARHYFGDNRTALALAAVMAAITLIQYAGVILCGLWRLRPRMTPAGWLCLLLVLTAWLLPGPANHPRFRVPVEPILCAAAAIGWLGLVGRRRRRRAAQQQAGA